MGSKSDTGGSWLYTYDFGFHILQAAPSIIVHFTEAVRRTGSIRKPDELTSPLRPLFQTESLPVLVSAHCLGFACQFRPLR